MRPTPFSFFFRQPTDWTEITEDSKPIAEVNLNGSRVFDACLYTNLAVYYDDTTHEFVFQRIFGEKDQKRTRLPPNHYPLSIFIDYHGNVLSLDDNMLMLSIHVFSSAGEFIKKVVIDRDIYQILFIDKIIFFDTRKILIHDRSGCKIFSLDKNYNFKRLTDINLEPFEQVDAFNDHYYLSNNNSLSKLTCHSGVVVKAYEIFKPMIVIANECLVDIDMKVYQDKNLVGEFPDFTNPHVEHWALAAMKHCGPIKYKNGILYIF